MGLSPRAVRAFLEEFGEKRDTGVYNKKTKKFVMWMHVDANDYGYAQSGVAVSDKPNGPYKYLGSVKPNGQQSRDMTLYKDEDDRAYLIYSSESNKTMHVCLLNDDYLSPTTTYTRITSAQNREAPAVFKYNKKSGIGNHQILFSCAIVLFIINILI